MAQPHDIARLRERATWRNERNECVVDPAMLIWAADRIEALEAGLRKVDAAWDALPGDKYHSPKVIESWLSVHMAPAIRAARALLDGERG